MQMNIIWRFYRDPDHRWKWQRLTADRTVVAESSAAYKEYEGCLADAHANGHVFHPSHAKLAHGHAV
jgi:hypothetical protein